MAEIKNLPKFVALKATQGIGPFKYLGVVEDEGDYKDHVAYSTANLMSEQAKWVLEFTATGDAHIKSCYNNKYWVRKSESENWIVATADEAIEDKTSWNCTLFKPTISSDGNTVTFVHVQSGKSVGTTTVDKNNETMYLCLQPLATTTPAVSTVVNYGFRSQKEAANLAGEVVIVSHFQLDRARIYDRTSRTLLQSQFNNSSESEQTFNHQFSFVKSRTFSWNRGGTSENEGVIITDQIPFINENEEVEVGVENWKQFRWEETVSEAEYVSRSFNVTVPPLTRAIASLVEVQASCDVPFSYLPIEAGKDNEILSEGVFRGTNNNLLLNVQYDPPRND